MMRCEKCGTDNPENSTYCSRCGEKIRVKLYCPECIRELPVGSKYCIYCGSRVRGRERDRSKQNRLMREKALHRKVRASSKAPRRKLNLKITAFAIIALLVVGLGWLGITSISKSRTRNQNTGFGENVVWSANVQNVAANFNCPCGKCGVVRLDLCTCDIERGAVEVKSYIQVLLNEGLSEGDVIQRVEERYGNRI